MGGLSPVNVANNDTWKSSDGGVTWSLVVAAGGWEARKKHTSVVFKNNVWVIGGHANSGSKNDVWYGGEGCATCATSQ